MALLRALVVERRRLPRLYIEAVLRFCGFECVGASGALGAMEFVSPNGIDLIVTGLSSRDRDGMVLMSLVTGGAFGRSPPPVVICPQARQGGAEDAILAEFPNATEASSLCPSRLVRAVREAFGETAR